MTEFAKLLQDSLVILDDLRPGSLIKAEVIDFVPSEKHPEYVIVNAGLKTEAYIPIQEFKSRDGSFKIAKGDTIKVVLEKIEDGTGETILSYEKAKRLESWNYLADALENNTLVKGVIVDFVRGGFVVELGNIRGFLPASLVDIRPVKDSSYLQGKELDFKVVKLEKPNNIVVSRRAALVEEGGAEREAVLSTLQEGQEIIGIVKNITDYGAFIDLGGVDGLLHITDISWRRIKHPSEVLRVGDEIKVRVIKFDKDKNRVSLGLKQLSEDPWSGISRRYPVNSRLFGKVTNLTDYGCFVEIEDGIEGLVHMSEMDWTNKNIHPAKIVSVGDEIEVMVLEVDEDRRRISLGVKQCKSNPWDAFAANHKKGEKVIGKIKSITDFGIFIGLDGNIDGLVHLSDISWIETGEKAIRNYKKGQEIEAVILAIDAERERISLGIKQLEEDVYAAYFAIHPKGTVVNGTITEVTPKQVTIDLGNGIEAKLRASDISSSASIKDASEIFSVGDEIQSTIISYDKKSRILNTSTKDLLGEQENVSLGTKLGDLLKEQMEKSREEAPEEEKAEKTEEI